MTVTLEGSCILGQPDPEKCHMTAMSAHACIPVYTLFFTFYLLTYMRTIRKEFRSPLIAASENKERKRKESDQRRPNHTELQINRRRAEKTRED